MFLPRRLAKLSPAHRLRKAALLLHEAETAARGGAGEKPVLEALAYAGELAAFLASDAESPEAVRKAAAALVEAVLALPREGAAESSAATASTALSGPIRLLNALRHLLLKEGGQAPADWDFIDPGTGKPDPAARRPFPGMLAFLEDIRSPFNVGSMFRSAEAFGVAELLLSPDTADPGHPRAARSAMGAIDLVPWRRASLEELLARPEGGVEGAGEGLPAFALELGGCPLDEFDFPERGIVVVGSEELGVSSGALARCELGKVSIPMVGAKGSLNVGVAFGILLSAWAAKLSAN